MSNFGVPKGLKVRHDIDELKDDTDIIMTIQDQRIITDNYEENDEEDVLENLNILDDKKASHTVYMKENMSKLSHAQTAHITENFQDDQEKAILPHYDEQTFESKGFRLNQKGEFNSKELSKLDQIKLKLKGKTQKLEEKASTIASEYTTQNRGFQKKNLLLKKKNKDLLKELSDNFDSSLNNKVKIKEENEAVKNFQWQDENEDEYMLQNSIDKQRKLQLKKDNNSNVEEKISKLVKENTELEKQKFDEQQVEFDIPVPKTKKKIVDAEEISEIKSSQDFLKNISTDEEVTKNLQKITAPTKQTVKDTKDGTQSVINVSLPSERLQHKNLEQLERERKQYDNFMDKEIGEEELEQMKKEVGFLEDDTLGVGLGNTLQTLRERGILLDDGNDYEGRSRDKRPGNDPYSQEKDDDPIKLEYRDATGKLMTKKQAYRYMCHIFHGKGPGKKRIEKAKKKNFIAEKQRCVELGNNVVMQALKKNQDTSGQAHMIL